MLTKRRENILSLILKLQHISLNDRQNILQRKNKIYNKTAIIRL